MKIFNTLTLVLFGWLVVSCGANTEKKEDSGPRKIEVLFLGHDSEHHNSAKFMPMLASSLAKEGINFTYTDDLKDLNPQTLEKYDALMIYANHDEISPSQEKALLNFVKEGNGLIPVHSASFCFRNSEEYIELVGAQFQKHETGTFEASIIKKDHPIMKNLKEFSTWDETYVHHKHSSDRIVLMERVEGAHHEPWTWIKDYGKGRVFYTAYGHDERTWGNPGFHELMKEGIFWAVGDKVKGQWDENQKDMPTLTYRDEPNIPNYEQRDPAPKFQLPLSPEESKKLIQVPNGFDLELFASEPDIINPISFEWDEKGRLWVIETVDYPNSVRDVEGVGDDRIKICEDTDGDGKADKFTVFADQLNIPTSIVFANGGLIVAQAPHFLFLADTDGDDKADVREVLIDGWGTRDTHAGPSNLKYGLNNNIWGVVGYSGFKGTVGGKEFEFAQDVFQFAPDASELEVVTNTSNNTWGLGFTEENDVFASTANNTHSVYVGIADKFFEGVEGIPVGGSAKIDGHYAMHPITPNVRQVDVFGGFTAAAGHNFYTARNYPEAYWNKVAFVCEPTGHLVHIARIEKDGAGYKEKDGWNLLASVDEWVSPVEAKVGPDGAVWVADWYNFIIQHNPTPREDRGGYNAENGKGNAYENPLRDKQHGRIWRVVYKGAKPSQAIELSKEDPKGLVKALKNDNMFWRTTAQRLLVERGETDVLPELYALVKRRKSDKMGMDPAALHALWTIHGLGALDGNNKEAYEVAKDALKHPSPAVRKAAIQVLPKTPWAHQAMARANILNDPDPHTRLAAILAHSELQSSQKAGGLLYQLSKEEDVAEDEWLSRAVYVAANHHKDDFVEAFLVDNPDYIEKQRRLELEGKSSRERTTFDDSNWETMSLPQPIEKAGLDIDGEIWFRKTIQVPAAAAGKKAMLHLGRVDDSDETWVNGVKVGGMKRSRREDRNYEIPSGILKAGKNVIAVKVVDEGDWGGIYGDPENLYLETSKGNIPLVGDWKYEVTKVRKGNDRNLFQESSIAETFVKSYWNKPPSTEVVASGEAAEPAQVIQMKVIKNAMKFDLTNFTVEAGKTVEIVFENPDFMQHNLVIVQKGKLEVVGAAADKLAVDPKGAEMDYVPDMPEVLYSTKMLNPEEKVTLRFTAPAEPGEYPYVCTFPGHWRIMYGTMNVVQGKKNAKASL